MEGLPLEIVAQIGRTNLNVWCGLCFVIKGLSANSYLRELARREFSRSETQIIVRSLGGELFCQSIKTYYLGDKPRLLSHKPTIRLEVADNLQPLPKIKFSNEIAAQIIELYHDKKKKFPQRKAKIGRITRDDLKFGSRKMRRMFARRIISLLDYFANQPQLVEIVSNQIAFSRRWVFETNKSYTKKSFESDFGSCKPESEGSFTIYVENKRGYVIIKYYAPHNKPSYACYEDVDDKVFEFEHKIESAAP